MGEALVRDQWASEFVERDISSSQTQLLAVFFEQARSQGCQARGLTGAAFAATITTSA